MKSFEAIINIPSPYRVHLFEELSQQLAANGCHFLAHFMSRGHGEHPKSWLNPVMNFEHKYWRDFGFEHRHLNLGFIIRSWFVKPDVLLVGSPFDTFTGILSAFTSRARVKCTWVEGQTVNPGKMTGFIGWFKRLVLSRFKYVAVPGQDASNYIGLHQKMTKREMPSTVFLPNLIDESRFRPRGEWEKTEIERCRALFHATGDERVCLIPARLTTVKGLLPFIDAINSEQIKKGWRIVFLGKGALKNQIVKAIKSKGISEQAFVLDAIPYEQMPLCYASADLFLLPSILDRNPLTVPEALHSGLPIALSDQAGNVEEGVTDGRNGWRLPVNEPKEYSLLLEKIFSTSVERLREMGRLSKHENAMFWDTKRAIAAFVSKINNSHSC